MYLNPGSFSEGFFKPPGSGGGTPDVIGNIFYRNETWSDLTGITTFGGGTWTPSGGLLYTPSGGGDFNAGFILANGTNNNQQRNTDENLECELIYQIGGSRGDGLSIGRGGVVNAAFQYQNNNDSVRIWYDGFSFYGEHTSIGLGTQDDDMIRQYYRQRSDIIYYGVENLTRSTSVEYSVQCNMAAVKNFRLPNMSWPAMWNHSGYKTIHSYRVTSNSLADPYIVCVGDSKTFGFSAESMTARWPALLAASNVSVYAGDGDDTGACLDGIAYVAARTPVKAILFIGCNDIRAGVSSGTWQSNYQNIVTALTNAGADVIHMLPAPEDTLDQSGLKSWIQSTYSGGKIIDPSVGWSNGTHLSADGVHPNATGHSFIAGKANSSGYL